MKPRVYLAGKIGKNDWRHALVRDLRQHERQDGFVDAGSFVYTGPFFVGCDHGCFHGANRHGARNPTLGGCPPGGYTEKKIVELCLRGIGSTDLLFAYITERDAYGTIAELQHAFSTRKYVVISFAPGIATVRANDFWFVSVQAKSVYFDVREDQLPELVQAAITSFSAHTQRA